MLGWLAGGLSPLAVLLLPLAWAVYAVFFASLGLWFSTISRTSMQATLRTLITVLVLSGGGWLEGTQAGGLLWSWLPPAQARECIRFQVNGLTPPMPLLVLSLPADYPDSRGMWSPANLRAALEGLACYAVAGWVLWWRTRRRFRAEAGPAPLPSGTQPPLGRAGPPG